MDFELLIVYLIFGLIFFGMGWKAREWHARYVLDKLQEKYVSHLAETFKRDVVNIKVEDTDGTFFVYKKEDGSYLAHGENMSKLEDILNEKFPGKFFNATPEDLEKLKTR